MQTEIATAGQLSQKVKLQSITESISYTVANINDFKKKQCRELNNKEKILKRNWKALQQYRWACKKFPYFDYSRHDSNDNELIKVCIFIIIRIQLILNKFVYINR